MEFKGILISLITPTAVCYSLIRNVTMGTEAKLIVTLDIFKTGLLYWYVVSIYSLR